MNQLTLQLKPYAQEEPEDYLVVKISVDEVPLADFNDLATDLPALIQSSECAGEYFILTCWCGAPGCAGLRQPIHVQHTSHTIVWQIAEPAPKRHLIFDRIAYTQAIQTCIKQGKRLIAYRRTAVPKPFIITPSRNESLFFDEQRQL